MQHVELQVDPGVIELLKNAHRKSPYEGERFYFDGDLCKMAETKRIADSLGIKTDIDGGIPFVMSISDWESVNNHLISEQKGEGE